MKLTHTDLTRGNIFSQLVKLSLPIMATSFMQMAYNLTDMIWIGRVGSGAVAAVGTAGFFVWFGNALLFSTKIGAEVNVSQSLGRQDLEAAAGYGRSSFRLAFLLSAAYGLFLVAGAKALMGFFALGVDNGYDVTA
ncbi:MAG TPA: MATE family efflux transporter, partial [Firmicutes bacterium]|nr:MATE family efflux transporter [Bacillota bacterium]